VTNAGLKFIFFANQDRHPDKCRHPHTAFNREASRHPVDTGPTGCHWPAFSSVYEFFDFSGNRLKFSFPKAELSVENGTFGSDWENIVPAGSEIIFLATITYGYRLFSG